MTAKRSPDRASLALGLGLLFLAPVAAVAQTPAAPAAAKKGDAAATQAPDSQDKALARYLEAARALPAADPNAWMQGLSLDLRARRVNDIVTVRVEENITASGSSDAAIGKTTSTGAGISTLLGLQNKIPAGVGLGDLASTKSATDFKGSGSTNRASVLTATLSARVAEVLPNGDLLVEGIREIEINGDRQIVVLTGVARVVDIGAGNVVSSSNLGQLSIRYFGRGLTKGSMSPGWLVRLLNKVF
ncbi:MAG: flagellar basal body L-ring protein FlgH [Vicinamibacterales bacterium]